MGLRGRLTAFLIALTLVGCKGSTPSANGADGAGSASSGSFAGGTQTENVLDTTMNNETAFTVKIPAKWSFQGVLLQGGLPTCESYFLLSWRAKSPDGLSSAEQMPQMLWAYGTGPHPTKGCMPITGPISGQDFLKYLAASMQLDYAADQPMAAENAAAQKQWQDADAKAAPMYAQRNLPAPKDTGEVTGAVVQWKNGTTTIKGLMVVNMHCLETTQPGMHSILHGIPDRPTTTVTKCTADVSYVSAPESQYAALVQAWQAPGMGAQQNTQWGNAWVQRYAKNAQQESNQLIKASWAALDAEEKEIAHTMAMQQEEHDQFLSAMQASTDASMARAGAAMAARSTAASDVVDFALDRQTVLNPQTGLIAKVPDQVTVGAPLQKVHGNGTP
jgi:hypothetical protein